MQMFSVIQFQFIMNYAMDLWFEMYGFDLWTGVKISFFDKLNNFKKGFYRLVIKWSLKGSDDGAL
jgi:hypothetical protein